MSRDREGAVSQRVFPQRREPVLSSERRFPRAVFRSRFLPMRYMIRVASLVAFAATLPLPAQVTLNQYPMREFGQNVLPSFGTPPSSVQPNLVDGRGLNDPTSIAFDYSVNPPRVW